MVEDTYGIGKTSQSWIKDGMPTDITRYKEEFEKAKKKAKQYEDKFKSDLRKNQPIG